MRKIIITLRAAAIGLSGCTLTGEPDFDTESKPRISVILRQDATAAQREAVEAVIRALPGVEAITFETSQEAYEAYRSSMKDDPAFDPSIKPETMPSSFRFTTTDLKTYQQIRDGSFAADTERMPGVARVVIQCATLAECKANLPTP